MQKVKTIQNYIIQSQLATFQDGNEIFMVCHKVLKKNFTLKKASFKKNSVGKQNQINEVQQSYEKYQNENLQNQTRILLSTLGLKRQVLSFVPKCIKMLKTINHKYIVYQKFPTKTLSVYLSEKHLNFKSKIYLIRQIIADIKILHDLKVCMVGLSLENIFVNEDGSLFFADFSLARVLKDSSETYISICHFDSLFQYLAPQVRYQDRVNLEADIYSLGLIIQKIVQSPLKVEAQKQRIIQKLIDQMVEPIYSSRPTISQVDDFLKNRDIEESIKSDQSPKKSIKVKVSDRQKSPLKKPKVQIKSFKSFNNYQYQEINSPTFTAKSMKRQKFYIQCQSPLTVKNKTISVNNQENSPTFGKSRTKHDEDIFYLNKKRNYCYFLLDLFQFVLGMKKFLDLAYFFLHKAAKVIREAQKEAFTHYMNQNNQHFFNFHQILASEAEKYEAQLFKLKIALNKQKKQEEYQNEQKMKERTVHFSQQVVVLCEQQMTNWESGVRQKITEVLFKTYLLLKNLSPKFWDEIYQDNLAFLKDQKYFKEEKKLGLRYIKNKISQILKKESKST